MKNKLIKLPNGQEVRLNALIAEIEKRGILHRTKIYDGLFKQQQEAFKDHSNFIACQCSRRAGKSYFIGSKLFYNAKKYKGSIIPYIALTRRSARFIMWPVLKEIDRIYGFKSDFREHDMTILTKEGSTIALFGADVHGWIDRLRGGKYPFVGIDESASFGEHLTELVDDVLTPAIADYNGQIALVGSPGVTPHGFFYEATEQKKHGFNVYKWTVHNNPHMKNIKSFLENLKKRKNWTEENPTYRREWLNEWVIDLDALVYKFNDNKNIYNELPKREDWYNIIGVDYGWHDQVAFCIVSYNPHSPFIFVIHSEGHSHMIPSSIANRLIQLRDKYKPIKIVADTGGLGKSITEEMIQRYSIAISAAEKKEKMTNISLLNGDFIDGNLKIHESLKPLINQLKILQKDDKGLEDPNFPNDLCDAMLYAYREARAYTWEPERAKAKTKNEKWEQEAEDMLQKELDNHEQRTTDWWNN